MDRDAVQQMFREDGAAPCCWCCQGAQGCCCIGYEQKCAVRVVDQCAQCFFWWAGAYGAYTPGEPAHHFQRARWEKVEKLKVSAVKPQAKPVRGVYSYDLPVPDADGGTMTARVYANVAPQRASVVLFMHGGGYVMGHPWATGHDDICSTMAEAGHVVVSVDYRLAPEHPFPTGVRDSYAAMRWMHSADALTALPGGCDPAKNGIALSGDSAGGNFALVLASLARDGIDADLEPTDEKFDVRQMVLIYPGLFYLPGIENVVEHKTRYFLKRPVTAFFISAYLQGSLEEREAMLADRRCSPCIAGLDGLPRTTLVSASDDSLRPSLELFEKLLEASTTDSKRLHYEKTTHGFATMLMIGVSQAKQCQSDIIAEMTSLLD